MVFGKNIVGAQASPSNAGTTMVESPDLKMNTDGGVRNNGWVKREAVSAEMVKKSSHGAEGYICSLCCSTVCAHFCSVSPVGEVGKCVISTVAFVLLKAVIRIHVGFV